MAERTNIGWTDSTANLWIGCSKASAACDDCYAEELMGTTGNRLQKVVWGPKGDRIRCAQGWNDLRKWQRAAAKNGGVDPKLGRRRFVFINSLSDFFDNHRTVIWRPEAWALFRECTHLVLILVTKRPQLIRRELPAFWDEIAHRVYIITTAEDQPNADVRVPALLDAFEGIAPPAVLGVSVEPMLGPLDLQALAPRKRSHERVDALQGLRWRGPPGQRKSTPTHRITWVIVGGESGDKTRRPLHPAWVLVLQEQCEAVAGVAFFFKQWGTWLPAAWESPDWRGVATLYSSLESGLVARWPDGHVGDGRRADHGGVGITFRFQKPRDRNKAVEGLGKPDQLLHGRIHQAFPDERMAA